MTAIPDPKRVYLSPTGIAAFSLCPLSAHLRKVDTIDQGEPNMKMRIGLAFHAAWEQFTGLPPEKRSFDLLNSNIILEWDRMREETRKFDVKKWATAKEKTLQIASQYWYEFGTDPDVSGGQPEQWLERPIGFFGDTQYVLRARVDYAAPGSGPRAQDHREGPVPSRRNGVHPVHASVAT